jgi:chorismate synthase
MLRFSTAGESHGEALVALLSGMPAGVALDLEFVNRELWRRQQGYGRGGRMRIERDQAHLLSGVRHGKTIGSPIAILLANKDWQNWTEALPIEEGDPAKHKRVASPRPGHADLAGAVKYNFSEARYVLERASARESAARVAAGAIAKLLLRDLGIEVLSHVIAVGSVRLESPVDWEAIRALAAKEEILLSCVDPATEARMKEQVDIALRTGDSVGGIFEVVAHHVPPGLGTYANWDERLDAQLAAAVMSLQAVKAVEIGDAVRAAASLGSSVHDEIAYERDPQGGFTGFTRRSNHAGGLEGGVSNGEEIRLRGYLKPISTLRRPLASVDFATREPVKAAYERSDVCVVPAAGVAAEAMVALTLARCALEKFGGDSLVELQRNFDGYCQQLRNF